MRTSYNARDTICKGLTCVKRACLVTKSVVPMSYDGMYTRIGHGKVTVHCYLGSSGTNYAIANVKLVDDGIASLGRPPWRW